MPQQVRTIADEIATVGADAPHYQSIQTAIDDTPAGTRVHIFGSYTPDGEGPITLTDRRHLSADHGTKIPPLTVETTHKRPPGVKLEGFETPAVTLKGSKFATLGDVHISPGGAGFRAEDTDENSCNTVDFVRCTADRPDGDGFFLDGKAHAARLRDVTIVGGENYGIFANGGANILIDGGRIEDCAEAGIKARRCEAFRARGCYLEHNATAASDADAELTLSDCPDFEIGGHYCHALEETPSRAISLYGSCPDGTVRRSHYLGYPDDPPIRNRARGGVSIE